MELKLGIYGDYGSHTCAGYPGSIDHLELDAQVCVLCVCACVCVINLDDKTVSLLQYFLW